MNSEKEEQKQKSTNPWAQRGGEDVAYQRQAQVTWWTLLGGIAAAALLTQVEPLITAIQSGRWYYLLYFLATALVIVNSWVQIAWGALVLKWPIAVPSSICIFMGGLSLSLAAINISRPGLWFAALAFVLIFSQLMQYTFKRTEAWLPLPAEAVRRVRIGIYIYWAFVLVSIMASILILLLRNILLEIILGIIAFGLSSLALFWQHVGMEGEKKHMGIA